MAGSMMIKNETWLDKITEFSLCGFIFTLPFSKSMVEVFFSCALVSWFLQRVARFYRSKSIPVFKPSNTPLDIPMLGFIFVAFLSVLASHSISLSLKGFFSKLLEWVMIYFIVTETVDSKKRFKAILAAMLLSMTLVGIDGLYQCVTGVDFLRGYLSGGRFMIQGPFSSRNGFAGWLTIMIPLVVSIIYIKKDNIFGLFQKQARSHMYFRSLIWILTGILIICMVLTYSRGALIAVQLSILFFAFFNKRKVLLITMMLLVALSFTSSYYIKRHIGSMGMIAGFDRIGLWREALAVIEDFPLTGCGINTYAVVGPHYKISGGGGCYPHNSYLQMAAESGLLGLGAFIWIIVILFRTSLANIDKVRDKPHGIILLGLLAGLFGFLVHSFVDVNIYTLQLCNLMWFTMALIISAHKIASEDVIR